MNTGFSLKKIGIKSLQLAGLGLLVKGASLLKLSFIVGSHAAFFSGSNIAVPLVGLFGAVPSFFIAAFRALLYGSFGFASLAFVIPGLCASLYWTTNHWSVRLALPLLCFVIFVTHPVGSAAVPYACYWLIPMILYFVPQKNIFFTSLGSTFTAHAVGSVIWLYTIPMTAGMWLALIPIVALERLCFATGMVTVVGVVTAAQRAFKSLASIRTSTAR